MIMLKNISFLVLELAIQSTDETGKSHLISVVQELGRHIILTPDSVITAPTGVAVYNFSGRIINQALNLSVQHKGMSDYKPLTGESLHALRRFFLKLGEESEKRILPLFSKGDSTIKVFFQQSEWG